VSLVVTRLMGGLGNQMFQYAAGRALALRCAVDLKLDVTGFATKGPHTRRTYELGSFAIKASLAGEADLARFGRSANLRSAWRERLMRSLRVDVGRSGSQIYREPHFRFDPAVAKLRAPIYLDGYWQTEKYFLHIADQLRREFALQTPLVGTNATLAAQISATNAVSLHVRRGDYVSDPTTNRYHGVCSLDYYQRAVEFIKGRTEAPHVFIFSDDPEWSRTYLRFSAPTTFVDVNSPDNGVADLRLMSGCRHHILANSSFSWWGAWLNPSTAKIVIAPSRWFADAAHDTQDLIPPAWVRL
jgi:hypothetical protein